MTSSPLPTDVLDGRHVLLDDAALNTLDVRWNVSRRDQADDNARSIEDTSRSTSNRRPSMTLELSRAS